jgi:hypothetical protein
MTVAILLVAIAILLYMRHPKRDYSLGIALLIAAFTCLAIEIHLLRFLGDVFALAFEHWIETVLVFSAAILLIVPAIMLYVAVSDQIDSRALARAHHQSSGEIRNTVLSKFERRVATLMALGYGRTQAESTALHQMKRDLDRYPNAKQASNNHI